MISTNNSLKNAAAMANKRIESLSKDSQKSELQQEYLNLLEGLLVEKDLDNPFSQSPDQIKAFFQEASERWEKRKTELGY